MPLTDYDVLLWDFDGVILDSMHIRDLGFEKVLSEYPPEQLNELLNYHRRNGGLSRYVKFRYFFEEIRNEAVSEDQIKYLAGSFSDVMRKMLINPDNLIHDSVSFIRKYSSSVEMHVVSGSDQEELRYLCKELGLSEFFSSINGSPTPKTELVSALVERRSERFALIGDSMNDFDAAKSNGVDFFGYNNTDLAGVGSGYINSFAAIL
ncbi:HAD family hydrolase [Fulvivirga sedimenti]|uniref:phosphoglycolate phosphatase n=1 Tax=Fulvivirga sedimenti TaxID=2879465 RepID=A0A9X1HJV5_9BACT|nr:HAD hydrolase-like protein [Fulvivirga sedimenti]MCA6073425.1 HAD hydrolase-like protein [Fulvivirga sedimenti]